MQIIRKRPEAIRLWALPLRTKPYSRVISEWRIEIDFLDKNLLLLAPYSCFSVLAGWDEEDSVLGKGVVHKVMLCQEKWGWPWGWSLWEGEESEGVETWVWNAGWEKSLGKLGWNRNVRSSKGLPPCAIDANSKWHQVREKLCRVSKVSPFFTLPARMTEALGARDSHFSQEFSHSATRHWHIWTTCPSWKGTILGNRNVWPHVAAIS